MKRYQQHKHALGSEAVLTLVLPDTTEPDPLFTALWSFIDAFERRFSRFRDDSELSRLNRQAGGWIDCSQEMHDILSACLHYAELTGGLFNPFILPDLQRAGYKGSWPRPADHDPKLDMSDRNVPAASLLELDDGRLRIPKESALDLGGIGKGYALDQLSVLLADEGVGDYWLSLGGDILSCGFDLDSQPWSVGIASAKQSEATVATVINQKGTPLAIASSGVIKRHGDTWHHIIDPRTGRPSDSAIVVASAVGSSATAADVYAKCFVIDPGSLRSDINGSVMQGVVLQSNDDKVEILQSGDTIHV